MSETEDVVARLYGARMRFGMPGFQHDAGEPHSQFVFDVLGEAIQQITDLREQCAKVADQHADGRAKQSAGAKSHGLKREARDFETMAMAARQIANDIRTSPLIAIQAETTGK